MYHGDIREENLLLFSENNAMIADLGTVKKVSKKKDLRPFDISSFGQVLKYMKDDLKRSLNPIYNERFLDRLESISEKCIKKQVSATEIVDLLEDWKD